MSQATLDVLNCYWSVIVFFAICVPRQLIAHVNVNHRGKETRYLPRIHLFFANYSYSHKHSKRRSTIDISIYINAYIYICTGLHNLCHPTIRDGSTWSKFGAHGEHGDVFLFSNLGALWFSENLIRYSLHVCVMEVKNNLFFLQTLLFTAFLVRVLKILTYALVSSWSSVSSGYEHVKRKMHHFSRNSLWGITHSSIHSHFCAEAYKAVFQ